MPREAKAVRLCESAFHGCLLKWDQIQASFTSGFDFGQGSTGVVNCQVTLCTRTLNHVAVDNQWFQKQGYGRMVQRERGDGVERGGSL